MHRFHEARVAAKPLPIGDIPIKMLRIRTTSRNIYKSCSRSASTAASSQPFHIRVPHIPLQEPEPSIQIVGTSLVCNGVNFHVFQPFLPDNYNSGSSNPATKVEESSELLVVAEASTHISGGPSHKLMADVNVQPESSAQVAQQHKEDNGNLFQDITDDLLSPEVKHSILKFFK